MFAKLYYNKYKHWKWQFLLSNFSNLRTVARHDKRQCSHQVLDSKFLFEFSNFDLKRVSKLSFVSELTIELCTPLFFRIRRLLYYIYMFLLQDSASGQRNIRKLIRLIVLIT